MYIPEYYRLNHNHVEFIKQKFKCLIKNILNLFTTFLTVNEN